jgi:hypothetical protein
MVGHDGFRFSPAILVAQALSLNTLFHRDGNPGRTEGRIVGDVQVVSEQQLQRVFAGFERDFGLGAAIAEVHVTFVLGNRHAEFRQFRVDQEVMVPGMRRIVAGRHDGHTLGAENNLDGVVDRVAISRTYEEYTGVLGCCVASTAGAGASSGFSAHAAASGRQKAISSWIFIVVSPVNQTEKSANNSAPIIVNIAPTE